MEKHHIIPRSIYHILLGEKYRLLEESIIELANQKTARPKPGKILYHSAHPNYTLQIESLLDDLHIDENTDVETLKEFIEVIYNYLDEINNDPEGGEVVSIDEISLAHLIQ
ncbi:hypothetical protein B6S12_08820 [Helicobacter valdiviensis]|uniref:Uncharacterized protein n=1 Tax=Helicobacter valdiviensis TaxID=1458358 RepID=A0A2W6NJD6_9HELI|nr:hypothetical protein [Helicobacter valdiviensis]PZT47486.1 hypothetical protein B6S12_08820 [Helicobacter valdiviensis]